MDPATLVPAVSEMIQVAFEHRSFVEARDSDVAVRVQFDVQGFVGLLQELIKMVHEDIRSSSCQELIEGDMFGVHRAGRYGLTLEHDMQPFPESFSFMGFRQICCQMNRTHDPVSCGFVEKVPSQSMQPISLTPPRGY